MSWMNLVGIAGAAIFTIGEAGSVFYQVQKTKELVLSRDSVQHVKKELAVAIKEAEPSSVAIYSDAKEKIPVSAKKEPCRAIQRKIPQKPFKQISDSVYQTGHAFFDSSRTHYEIPISNTNDSVKLKNRLLSVPVTQPEHSDIHNKPANNE